MQKLHSLVKKLEQKNILSTDDLITNLDETLLKSLEGIEYTTFIKRRNRIYTKLHIQQIKYNMFREENEGFAKLIVELMDSSNVTPDTLRTVKENIFGLIGYFDLDPNRVLDLTLDAYQNNFYNESYVQLIRLFKRGSIVHLLGLKYQLFMKCVQNAVPVQEMPSKGMLELPNQVSYGLCYITANLVKHGLVMLDELWPHLGPRDSEMEAKMSRRVDLSTKRYMAVYVVSLNSDEKNQEDEKLLIQKQEEEIMNSQFIYNHKLWLMIALVELNDWEHFESLWALIGSFIDLHTHHPLRNMLFNQVEWMIQHLYERISPKLQIFNLPKSENNTVYAQTEQQNMDIEVEGSGKDLQTKQQQFHQANDIMDLDLYKNLARVFKVLGSFIGKNAQLLTKLCRVFNFYFESYSQQMISIDCSPEQISRFKANHEHITNLISGIMGRAMLPGLQWLDCNPGIAMEFWDVFQKIEYSMRYFYYNECLSQTTFSSPALTLRVAHCLKNALKCLKTLTSDHGKQNSWSISKLTNTSPVFVFNEFIRSIKSYSNQIPFIVNGLNLCNNLSYDIVMYIVLRHFSDPQRSKLNPIDASTEQWCISIVQFGGLFVRKYFNVELTGVFVYFCNKMMEGDSSDLSLFNEIISKMSGVDCEENFNQNQILALAGGLNLQMQSAQLTQEFRSAKKSTKALESFFWETSKSLCQLKDSNGGPPSPSSLAFQLLVLLGQQRSKVIHKQEFQNSSLRFIGMLYDQLNNSFVQFLQFLRLSTESYKTFAALLPTDCYQKLVLVYKMPFETAIHICRHAVKQINLQSETRLNDLVQMMKQTYDQYDQSKLMIQREDYNDVVPSYLKSADFRQQLWKQVSPELYAYFWMMSCDNIYVPIERYEAEIKRLKDDIIPINEKAVSENISGKERIKVEKDIERMKHTIEKLIKEQEDMTKKKDAVILFLEKKREVLFANLPPKIPNCFIQSCLYPRLVLEPIEAIYCAKFVYLIHQLNKLAFKGLLENIYHLTMTILPVLQNSTEQETVNVSTFYVQLFKYIQNWNKEDLLKEDIKQLGGGGEYDPQSAKFIIFTIQKRMIAILEKLNLKVGYIQLRNTLIFLGKTIEFFPSTHGNCKLISEFLKKCNPEEENLKKMKESYEGQLIKIKPNLAEDPKNPKKEKKDKDASSKLRKGNNSSQQQQIAVSTENNDVNQKAQDMKRHLMEKSINSTNKPILESHNKSSASNRSRSRNKDDKDRDYNYDRQQQKGRGKSNEKVTSRHDKNYRKDRGGGGEKEGSRK